ncbi:ABC transporter ATP-binding protein [Streptacidiphilus jiangxiensis]|uniref:Oligopeptide/dipeptide ABC transporter, ATP-binding protein, C-terminal domain-containing protein n=1 Tax=Streptacidiphilus jiangxiensis TaxID=235985 RepID=A0A1H7P3I5_STRJI|nr:oligopeptide/dipeptide ABC transporter ATP-binding protein [Streptacidiphilus jiangxiensis]SEL30186.1 oligopeptide/dipeptide ABC transporter, ATP-binding protein, C-terminal domain-containing protein [Streptacidiphilus jiangxiensis]
MSAASPEPAASCVGTRPTEDRPAALLDIRELTVEFRQGRRTPPLRAVDGVSLSVAPGETLGLVGESGSGKSTIGRAVLGLTPVRSGTIRFEDADITRATAKVRRELSARLQVVFQDPYSSLNPARTIGSTLAEPLLVQGRLTGRQSADRVAEMLGRVGLPPDTADRYPAQFSGGQRQRIAIARALMPGPRLVICDEPVSALDLSVQAQVMNLLAELQEALQLSYLFVAHDLPVVRHLSHRILVLYRGQVMETGPAEALYARPVHPYTRMLIAAVPEPDPGTQRSRRAARRGGPLSAGPLSAGPPSAGTAAVTDRGCAFAARCVHALDICRHDRPLLLPVGAPDRSGPVTRSAACHRASELLAQP